MYLAGEGRVGDIDGWHFAARVELDLVSAFRP